MNQLRFLVDSTETDDGDINLLLANVRHRMGSGIELAEIDLRWQVDELPEISGLTAHDGLAIKLSLMEALSNVLHHSKARTATLTARYDRASRGDPYFRRGRRLRLQSGGHAGCRARPGEHAQADRERLDRRRDCHRLRTGARNNSPDRIEGPAWTA